MPVIKNPYAKKADPYKQAQLPVTADPATAALQKATGIGKGSWRDQALSKLQSIMGR